MSQCLPSQDVRCHCKADEEGSKVATSPPIYSPHADHHGQEERHQHFGHGNSSYISITTDSSKRSSRCITEFNRWGDSLEKTRKYESTAEENMQLAVYTLVRFIFFVVLEISFEV